VTMAARPDARGVAIPDHSLESRAPATAMSTRNGARQITRGQSNTQTAQMARLPSTPPDAALTRKFRQSKRLARGKYVLGGDAAEAALP
jgi:hypothetical protein